MIYERPVRFPGLDEDVRIVKTPHHAFGILADGRRVGLADLRRMNRQAYRQRYGALALGFHNRLAQVAQEEPVRAVIYFRPELDWHTLSPQLYSKNPQIVIQAREALLQGIAKDAGEIAAELTAGGATVTKIGKSIPAVFASATPAQLRALGGDQRIKLVMGADGQVPEHRASGCNGGPDKTTYGCHADPNVAHNIDTVFNDHGYFGKGQRVAIYEDVGDCTLYESHESLAEVQGIHYSNSTPQACQNAHANQVASVISGTSDGVECGASRVEIYYPNSGEIANWGDYGLTSICHAAATVSAYEWMSGIGNLAEPFSDPPLAAVNESWGCLHAEIACENGPEDPYAYEDSSEWEGVTQDYFARMFDMVIVKAAGNNNCSYRQEACPFSLNSVCVGSADSTGSTMSYSSSYRNPGTDPNNGISGPLQTDREEPDLVAFGGAVVTLNTNEFACVARPAAGDTVWTGQIGTSFAAPVVTSLIALFREACEEPELHHRIDQRQMRSLLRTVALTDVDGPLTGPAYSTPRPNGNPDFLDGGGFILADYLAECNFDGTDLFIDLDDGEPMPTGHSSYQQDWTSPGETQNLKTRPGPKPQSFDYAPGSNSGRESETLFTLALDPGDRVRITFSWDGCAIDDSGTAPVSVSVDFDLFLYNASSGEYVWASQSIHDNNEGFDYTVPSGEGGNYKVILAWPPGAESCEGTNFVPAALTAIIWQ